MFSGKDKSKEKDSKKDSGGAKDSKHFSGGNHQRESFNKKASESSGDAGKSSDAGKSKSQPSDMDTSMDGGADSEDPKTTITHHADGTHTTEHSDGEVSDHPSMDDAAQYMSAKHGMGMDPMSDMSQILGPDGGNGAMEQAGGHGMPGMSMGMGKRSTPSLY